MGFGKMDSAIWESANWESAIWDATGSTIYIYMCNQCLTSLKL